MATEPVLSELFGGEAVGIDHFRHFGVPARSDDGEKPFLHGPFLQCVVVPVRVL